MEKGGQKETGKCRITPSHFFRHRMMDRDVEGHYEFNTVIRGGKLFQEWACGSYYMAEKMKLQWIQNNQKKIRAEKYQGLFDAQEEDIEGIGVKIILPPSHTGSPRWYSERFQGKYFFLDLPLEIPTLKVPILKIFMLKF